MIDRKSPNRRKFIAEVMMESEILSAIDSLDSWLQLKKSDFFEENFLKLRIFLFGKVNPCSLWVDQIADLREDFKKKLFSFLVSKTDFGEDNNEKLHNFLDGISDFRDANMKKLCSFLIEMNDIGGDKKQLVYQLPQRFLKTYKENQCSLLVAMANMTLSKAKTHSLLVEMVDFWEDDKEKLYSLLVWVAVLPDTSSYKNERVFNNKENVYRLLVEMTELWEDDDNGKLNKEKQLHPLLLEITSLTIDECTKENYNRNLNKQKLCSLIADIAGLWKSIKGKLNKVKLCSWLAKKAGLWEHKKLFRLLLDVAFYHVNEYDDKSRIWETVEGIEGELSWILDFLRDKKWSEEGSSLNYFISDAVEMARDAQLLIDLRDSDPFIIFRIFNREDNSFINEDRTAFAYKVLDIWNWIKATKDRMLEFGVERAITILENAGEGGDRVVVGLEEDIKLLLGLKNKHTIFISGMAGIGKTTLARRLYDHANEFECRAWVCVSREWSRKEILIKLIRQLVDTDSKEFKRDVAYLEKMDNKGLKQMLRQHLQDMRYFIVLDDVWEKTFIKYAVNALPKDHEESRLVLTTRIADVYDVYDENKDYFHYMKYLDDYDSWELFLKTIFFGTCGQEFPKHLEKRGRKMLAECNGLPLAIKEIGRRWAKKSRSEWEELVESTDLSDTLTALESTYSNLDPRVKLFFLYLSFFKEGIPIRLIKLVDIWNVGNASSTTERYPHGIMDVLHLASITVRDDGKKTCRVNAVFHKLSIQKAVDELGLEILRNDGSNQLADDPCHRVIYCSRDKFTYSTDKSNNHLVSLFFHGGGCFDDSPSYWKHFERLEILDMEDFGLKILPDAVGMLNELKYLGLRNNYIQELPHSLGQLKNLEVLDIALNFTIEMPDVIWGISSLLHLYMSDVTFQKPMKIDNALKNLQTLTYISVDKLLGLEMLSGLRKLGIEELDGDTNVSKLFASLAKLKNLDHLILRGFRYKSMPPLDELRNLQMLAKLKLEGRLERLPSAKSFPPKMRSLVLVNSSLDEDPMPILEGIPTLCYLKLQNAYVGQQMVTSSKGFRQLTHLVIEELWNLRKIEVRKGGMNLVNKLDIKSCPYLETLPKDIMRTHGWSYSFNMVTTKAIAKKIMESDFIPEKCIPNIQP